MQSKKIIALMDETLCAHDDSYTRKNRVAHSLAAT
jgi:hypothetical protein